MKNYINRIINSNKQLKKLRYYLVYKMYVYKNYNKYKALLNIKKSNDYSYSVIGNFCDILEKRDPIKYREDDRTRQAKNVVDYISKYINLKNKIFLDIGAGYGALVLEAAKRGAKGSIGVEPDLFDEATEQIKKSKFNVKYVSGSGENLPFQDNYFDVIHTNAIEHFNDPKKSISEMIRVLKPGGKLILLIGNFWDCPDASHYYNHLNIPWSHSLFDHNLLEKYVNDNSFEFCGLSKEEYAKETIIQFQTLNRLSSDYYKKIIEDYSQVTKTIHYSENPLSIEQKMMFSIFKDTIKNNGFPIEQINGFNIIIEKKI